MSRARDVIAAGMRVLAVTSLLQQDLQPVILCADEPYMTCPVTDPFPVGKTPRYGVAGRLTGFIDNIKYFFQNDLLFSYKNPALAKLSAPMNRMNSSPKAHNFAIFCIRNAGQFQVYPYCKKSANI
jgi:hypothetical protein